jgi:hypothetical protein
VRPPPFTLRARHLLPIASPPLDGGWLRIDRGRIVALGPGRPSGPAVDLGDAIVLPGLVNAHTHLEFSTVQQPLSANGGLPAWIGRVVALRRQRPPDATAADAALSVVRGRAESAAAGVTAIGEIATAASLDAYAAPGPLVRVFREALGLSPAAGTAAFASAIRDLDRLHACGIASGVSPHAPYSVTAALGSRMLATARARGLPAAMHLAESREEEALLADGTGAFRELLESLGAWPAAAPPACSPPPTGSRVSLAAPAASSYTARTSTVIPSPSPGSPATATGSPWPSVRGPPAGSPAPCHRSPSFTARASAWRSAPTVGRRIPTSPSSPNAVRSSMPASRVPPWP